jgi:hypothetical protein
MRELDEATLRRALTSGQLVPRHRGLERIYHPREYAALLEGVEPVPRFSRRNTNMSITNAELENWFTYHAPSEEQQRAYLAIRGAAHNLAEVILENTPACADQSAAIRKVREAVMTANAAVACKGK